MPLSRPKHTLIKPINVITIIIIMSSEMSAESQQALASVKMANLRKKINAGSWNDNMEN